jgi:Fe-S-cluster containining protein
MEFAFSAAYGFQCKKCGICCHARALSLTEDEYKKFTQTVAQADYESIQQFYMTPAMGMHMYDVGFKGKDCSFLERKPGTRLCKIYPSRYIVCRIFPLTISVLPGGELLVGLIRCNGVSIENGVRVDERFVKKVLDSINDADPSFLREYIAELQTYHKNPLPFYTDKDLIDFSTKREFINRISCWLLNQTPKDKPLDVRTKSIGELLNSELSMRLQILARKLRSPPPMLLTPEDVRNLAEEIETELEKKLKTMCENVELNNRTERLTTLATGKTEMGVDGKPTPCSIDQKIPVPTPHLDKVEVTIRDLLIEKPMSIEATQLCEDYLAEMLSRVDHGGFPAYVPIAIMMESLYRLTQAVLTHAKAYSPKSSRIEECHVKDAITQSDSTYALQSILKEVAEEYKMQENW